MMPFESTEMSSGSAISVDSVVLGVDAPGAIDGHGVVAVVDDVEVPRSVDGIVFRAIDSGLDFAMGTGADVTLLIDQYDARVIIGNVEQF